MTTIQNVIGALEVPNLPAEPAAPPPARPLADLRMWPAELAALLNGNTRAVRLSFDGPPNMCTNCGGAGLLQVYVWTRGPLAFPAGKCKWLEGPGIERGWYLGETHSAPCPVCQEDGWREYLRANCGLKGADLQVSIENFRASGPYFAKEPALKVARGLLAQNERPRGFVTFWGEPGRGKSHLLKGMVNAFRNVRVFARYVNAADLIAEIRDRFGDERGGTAVEEAIGYYRRVRVLAIDEVDKLNLTDWSAQTLHRLLDARYNEQAGLLTLLAMNAAPESLPGDLEYLASRIAGGVAVEVAGGDMRGIQGMKQRKLLEQAAEEGGEE